MAGRVVLPSLIGLPRLPDAAQRLHRLVLDCMGVRFAWGVRDCMLWSADAIAAQLGADPAEHLRGTYSTQRQARRLMAPLGGLHGLATAVLGRPLPAPLLARAGDIGLLSCGAMGVCGGETWLVITSAGMGHIALAEAQAAWRVGHA